MFKYNGYVDRIHKAVKIANDTGLIDYIHDQIKQHDKYDYCDVTSQYIAKSLKDFTLNNMLNIEVYYPAWKYSRAIGYYTAEKPNTIHLNGYKILDIEQIVSNFHHENCHAWNDRIKQINVHHGKNGSTGKENTLHYSVNRYVFEYLNYNENVKKYSLINKIINLFKWW